MRSKEYLEEIRGSAGLVRAVLRKIEVNGKTVTFYLVTDIGYGSEDVAYARGVSAKYVPAGFVAEVKIMKSVPDEAGIRRAVADILKTRFPGVAAFVDPEDIAVIIDGAGGRFFITVGELERDRMTGDGVCLTGDNELFNGSLSFRAKHVDKGHPPSGFVPEQRPSRPVPAQYRAVFPSPVQDHVQGSLFGGAPLPEGFARREFVVFDLETTGLNTSAASGTIDRIIEVGAVKIKEGRIAEKFSTFVACPVRLSDEIVGLTGIRDEMLVGAPEIGDVIADFYKFTAGCSLVAHNIGFDGKFIRYYGEKEGFAFDQRQYDTVAMSQRLLHLTHNKLNNVADFFGFTFNHHRAFDDAFVTAKIFLELVRMDKDFT